MVDPEHTMAETKRLAATLVGMRSDDARRQTELADRRWEDITHAQWVTADLRNDRIRVRIVDGLVERATAG